MSNNSGITLTDVRHEAFETIRALRDKKIEVKDAMAIKGLLDCIIDTAKTQVEFIKSLPAKVKDEMSTEEAKAIAGTLRDRDADLDMTMNEIEQNAGKPYNVSQ